MARPQAAVRRRVPRAAVVATALSILLLVVVLVEARSASEPVLVPQEARVSPAAGGGCPVLDPERRPVRIMFVGDSMTQGRSGSATYRYWVWRGLTDPVEDGGAGREDVVFVGPTTTLNGPDGASAYEHLDHGFADQLEHAGSAGATFPSSREQFPAARLVRQGRPDVIVLQLGYNDANDPDLTPAELAERFTSYVEAVRAVAPDTRFVLGEIPPAEGARSTPEETAERNRRTAEANALVAERWGGSPCAVQVNRLRDADDPAWDPVEHTYDGAHPDPAGETLMADRMLESLGRLGVFAGEVHVYDADEAWDPRPRPEVTATDDGRVRVAWAREKDRLSATSLQLLVTTDGEERETRFYTDDVVTLDLGPGEHEVRAVVGRGLPGRMVSEPGEPAVVTTR